VVSDSVSTGRGGEDSVKRAVSTNEVEKLLKKIPEKFFLENFRLDKDVFQINSND
jgi:hypothetical protein